MKELNMSWEDIKQTPRHELTALLTGLNNYNVLHAFDGYDSEDISQMAKNKPQVRSQYSKYQAMQQRFGKKLKPVPFGELLKG